ncbi:hypothetical protein GEMRC1_003702 [Eukaryota sp. GEM-RC1]
MRILCVDHGGMKGISACEVLCQLEQSLGQPLYDCFDLFIGSSAGSVIAAGLALGLPIDIIKQLFLENRHRIFKASHSKMLRALASSNSALYKSDSFEEVLQEQFGTTLMNSTEITKKLCIITSSTSTEPASTFLFRNYEAPSRYPCVTNAPVWKAVRASSAAPVYFAPFIDATLTAPLPGTNMIVGHSFIDGAIAAKPASIAITEARALNSPNPITILSISPGMLPHRISSKNQSSFMRVLSLVPSLSPNLNHYKSVYNAIVDCATSTEEVDNSLQDCIALQQGVCGSFVINRSTLTLDLSTLDFGLC